MSRRPAARPLYLDLPAGPVFAIYHPPPADAPLSTAVLLCPPWGWNDITSYRARRAWAEHLADTGHPTLRFDFPGTGDSGGAPSDPGRLAAWRGAITGAAAWLRVATGGRRVAAIGMGLGGLITVNAIGDDADIDELVTWATPGSGRAFVRAERAFANLQTSRYSLTGEREPSLLPDGWMEVNGFVLSAETIAELEALTLSGLSTGRLRRALLLDHDGIPVDAGLRGHLEKAGVEVTTGAGTGWGAMTFHPERFDPPVEVFATVDAWLAAGLGPKRMPAPSTEAPAVGRDEAFLDVGGVRVRETPFQVAHEIGTLFGILAEPVDGPRPPLAAIFLNAGAVRRIGPNRLWVEAARRAAAEGLPTLRVDLEGIGDSDGDAGRYRDVGEFYRDDLTEFISAFLDALETRGYGDRFVLAGLCAGGFWAFNGADRDERAVAALMVNPGALEWHPALVKDRNARKLKRLRRGAWWRRILRGQVKRKNVVAVAQATASQGWRAVASLPARVAARGAERGPAAPSVERILDRLRDRGVRVVMAFSDDEPVRTELERDGVLAHLDRWPNMQLESLPGRDHTLRPIVAQLGVHELLVRELTAVLQRATGSARSQGQRPRSTSQRQVPRSDRRGAA
jgi:alpha-beta hydrolase superfamily lysophospholipase